MAALFAALGRQNPGNVGISRQARAEPSSARQSGPPDIELQAACQVSDLVSDLARQVSDLALLLAPAPATVEEFARAAAVTQPVISVTTAEATAAATVAATAAATAAPVAVSEVGVPTTGGTTTVRRQRGSRGRRGRGRAAAAAEGGGSGEGSETTVALADPLPASTALAAQAALAQAGRLERAVNEAAQSLLRATHAAARAAPSARRGLLSRASGQVVAALRQATSGETRRVVRRTQDQQRGRDLAVREARQLQRSDALQHNQGRSSDGSFQRGNNRVGRRHNHDQNRRAAQSRGPIRRRR